MSKKLLTVDDSKTIRLIVTRAFKPYEVEICEAANGVEGLSAASKQKPDVILLDITMPVMDGYEMLGKLRADPALKHIPVVMLTAETGKDNVLRIAKMGVRDYLVKPFKEELVVERIGRIIELQRKAAGPARKKAYADPLQILIVDDKPAIVDQVRAALSRTSWKFEGVAQPKAATDYFTQKSPDAIVISLSLPDNAAFALFDALRPAAQSRGVPILGLSVKTATAEQTRAQAAGFAGVLFKPVDAQDAREKLVQALNLDTSAEYFAPREGVIAITLPSNFTPGMAQEIEKFLPVRVTKSVEAGSNRVVLDLSQLPGADATVVKLCVHIVKLCQQLGLKHALLGCEAVCADCVNHAETQGWRFASDWAEALASFDKKALAA